MSKRTILVTAVSVATIVAGAVAIPAQASTSKASDCSRVATADHLLCLKVQLQHPYGRTFDGKRQGAWTEPNGKKIVHRITHGGYTKRQMHDQLKLEADEYRYNVTAVPVSVDAIKTTCGDTNGSWVISLVDADGKPGGTQLTYKRVTCS
jgi:hypothetical protein